MGLVWQLLEPTWHTLELERFVSKCKLSAVRAHKPERRMSVRQQLRLRVILRPCGDRDSPVALLVQIIQQSATIFNFLGALQQKAPPEVAIIGEKVSGAPDDAEWPAVLQMPQALVTQMQDIETLAKLLPKTASEVRTHCHSLHTWL